MVSPTSPTPSSSLTANREFDVIIYGASGFTGTKISQEIARNPSSLLGRSSAPNKLKWALAGRDATKLKKVLQSLSPPSSSIPAPDYIVVDVSQPALLVKTFKRAKIVINCVGPFRLYGGPVVKACVEAKTTYLDITGETEFIERTYALWNDLAIKNGVSIIPSCGYDSLPASCGVLHAKREFYNEGGIPTQSELFVTFGSGKHGITINATTFISAVLGFASVGNLRKLRKETHRIMQFEGPDLKMRKGLFNWSKDVSAYTIPMAVADVPVVKLGEQIVENHKDLFASGKSFGNAYVPPAHSPIRFSGYFGLTSIISLFYVFYLGFLLSLSNYLQFFRNILLKYPQYLTLGIFTFDGPTQEQLDEGNFTHLYITRGYGKNDKVHEKLSREIITSIHGPEMGYVATPKCVIACASVLLKPETNSKIPKGVVTPSVAFSNTFPELKEKLEKEGITFTVKSRRDL